MTLIRIRDTESCEPQPHLLWDSVWVQRLDASGGYGDWLLAGPKDQADSRGGLRSEAALHTATLIILFSDQRAPSDAVLPDGGADRRGWWGDSIRLEGEPDRPLGCLLWLDVERAILDSDTAERARISAEEGLAILAEQGAVARTDVTAETRQLQGMLGLTVRHYSHAGMLVYEQRFEILWQQSRRAAEMNFGDQGAFV